MLRRCRHELPEVIRVFMMIACCNDGTRPVIFKLERIDIPETEDERAYLEAHDFACGKDDAYTG